MPIRETFWNIPHWGEFGQYILGFLTILVFGYGVFRRVRRWRLGQPDRRNDHLGKRILSLVTQGVGQVRLMQDPYAWIMHISIYWGMLALFTGTILATIDWDITHLFFNFQFLTGWAYIIYELILDIFGILLLIGLGMAAYRRYVIRPPQLQNRSERTITGEDAYIILMLFSVAITGYLVEGLRIAVVEPDWAKWSPVGNGIASMMKGMGDPNNRTFHLVLWISHALVAFIFIASVPYTKLFHLFAAPLNIFFRSFHSPASLSPPSQNPISSVLEWRDFTWKQILDFETCVRCGRCHAICPTFNSGASTSPMDLMVKLDAHLWKNGNGPILHEGFITEDELWGCTTCNACGAVCPLFIDHLALIVDMRRALVMDGRVDAELQDALANLGRYGNSFGQSPRRRALWARDADPKIKDARREAVDTLWFVGDYASYSPALTEITRQTAQVFQAAGLDFGILYETEQNAGNDVRRVGEEGLFEMLAEKNQAALERCDFRQIVTTDPHTFNTLKNEYHGHNGLGRPVLHYTELLAQLISSGALKLTTPLRHKVTYQDPCYLGRYNQIYAAPRKVIEATGCTIVEMPRNRDRAVCCGAGGGRIWMAEGEVKERPSEGRLREAAALEGVDLFVVACPKDVTMYRDAVKTTGQEGRIAVWDLIELVHAAL